MSKEIVEKAKMEINVYETTVKNGGVNNCFSYDYLVELCKRAIEFLEN